MLTGHPYVGIPSETGFLPRLIQLRVLWWSRGKLRTSVFLRLAMANGRIGRAGVSADGLSQVLRNTPSSQPSDAIDAIYAALSPGKKLIGDKTPSYIRHIRVLADSFPEAVFIRMVRHPLDVTASLLKQPWGPPSVEAAAVAWVIDQMAFERAEPLIQARSMTVRLEDLISEPESEVGRVVAGLGLELVPEMMQFGRRSVQIANQNIHPESHAGLQHGLRRTRDWQSELTADEAAAAWAIVKGCAESLGYEGPSDQLPRRRRPILRGVLQLLGFNLSRQRKRLGTVLRLIGR